MKLIDLLVKELPKRGGWPDGAKCAWQDWDKQVRPESQGFGFYANELADNHRSRYEVNPEPGDDNCVTHTQYEAALAKNEGWIEWGGGECPVPQGTLVDVRYRCGKENHHVKAGIFGDDSGSDPEHHAGYWGGYNSQWDIIAYRLHRDINSRANDDRLEQDLNECIGQGVAAEWNGEGLPPVGTVCMANLANGWTDVKVAYIGDEGGWREALVFEIKSTKPAWADEFRQLRTEAEKAREFGIKLMLSCVTNYNKTDVIQAIEQLYDAGYRKEVK